MEGAQTNIEEEGAGLPLWVSCDQWWASLGLSLAYTYIPGVQNVESMGVKVWWKDYFIPTKCKAFLHWWAKICYVRYCCRKRNWMLIDYLNLSLLLQVQSQFSEPFCCNNWSDKWREQRCYILFFEWLFYPLSICPFNESNIFHFIYSKRTSVPME